MGASVKWREDRAAWFLFVYANGTQTAKRLGPTTADKRRGERLAREVEKKQRRGQLGLEKPKGKAVPFDECAREWLRVKVYLPLERGLHGHLSPKTAALREQAIRLHLVPHLGGQDVRRLDVSAIDRLWTSLLEERHSRADRPLSRRSLDIILGTLRQILADAVAKGVLPANPVDHWKAVQPRGRGSGRLRPVDPKRALDGQEREHFLATAQVAFPHYYPFVLFLAETGCRIGEAMRMPMSDLDLELGVARVYRQKTGGEPTDLAGSL